MTPENYEENMELITIHGFDEEDARKRYESGEIIFEAYHAKALKDGCLRLSTAHGMGRERTTMSIPTL